MKKNKLLIAIGAAVLIGIVSLLVYKSQNKSASDDVIRIGAVLPLTGFVSADGEESRRGAVLAIDEINRSVTGVEKRVSLEIVDSKYTVKDSLSAYKVLQTKNISGLLLMGELPCEVLAAQVQKDDIVTFATILGSDKVLDMADTYIRAWIPISRIGKLMARYSIMRLNCKRAAVLYVDTEFGVESNEAFCREFGVLGGEVLHSEKFSAEDIDVKNAVIKALQVNPEVIYVTGFAQGYVSAMNQIRERGFAGPIVTDMGVGAPQVYGNLKKRDNIYFVSGDFGPSATIPEYRVYRDAYFKEFGSEPKLISVMHYLSVKLLHDALTKNNKGLSGKDIKKHLVSVDKQYRTPFGEVRFDQKGEIFMPIIICSFDSKGIPFFIDTDLFKEVNCE